ncbi:MAG: hypothetical protein GX418_13170 [Clostridiales bacterium]|nr:hypothetical protein [Clostridiales bacterium]
MTREDAQLELAILQTLDPETCSAFGDEALMTLIVGDGGETVAPPYLTKSLATDILQPILLLLQIAKAVLEMIASKKEKNAEEVIGGLRKYLEGKGIEKRKIDQICTLIAEALKQKKPKA